MSGHSKWSKIKRQKAVADVKRGQVFTKLLKQITLAAQKGGDPASNPSLRFAIDKAKYARMPAENIKKAIDRGSGETSRQGFEELTIEGYGPAGVAFLVECVTNNRNRTINELRSLVKKSGGNLGESGCTAYIFADRKKPMFTVSVKGETADKVQNLLDELKNHEDVERVYSNLKINSGNPN